MKLTLGRKLGLGFGVVLAMKLFNTAMSYVKSAAIRQNQDLTFELRYPTLETARRLQRDLNQTQSKGRHVVLLGTQPGKRGEEKKTFDENWEEVDKDIADMDNLAPNWTLQANRDRLAEIKKILPALRAAQESAMT